jgi:DNA repair protein RecN (Recombination protein N)
VGAELGAYLDRLDADPEALAAVLSRQAELKALTRKYAADVDGVLAWAEEARRTARRPRRLRRGARGPGRAARRAGGGAGRARGAVTAARVEAAARLAEGTTAELGGLAMRDARLLVEVRPRLAGPDATDVLRVGGADVVAGGSGVDEVELRLVAHGSAVPQPLHKGASGGELSRVMLALEVALAGADPVPTMVFDEVDAGVGGRAAVEIGRRLARLATRHQVIVVTHLPQVAAYADRHLVVDKVVDRATAAGGAARSSVRTVADADRIVELARMLAGLDDTDTGRGARRGAARRGPAHREADRAAAGGRGRPGTARRAGHAGRGHPGPGDNPACLPGRGGTGVPQCPA